MNDFTLFDKLTNIGLTMGAISVYDCNELTIQELISLIVQKINGLLDNVKEFETNTTNDITNFKNDVNGEIQDFENKVTLQNKTFQDKVNQDMAYLMGEGLEQEVAKQFAIWKNDGTFDKIINEQLLNGISSKVDGLEKIIDGLKETISNQGSSINILISNLGLTSVKKYQHLVTDNDWTVAFRTALKENNHILVPNGDYNVSDTIIISDNQSIKGQGLNTVLHYTGTKDYKKTVIQIGKNPVGEQPNDNVTNASLEMIKIVGHNLVGFGVYGTYLDDGSNMNVVRVEETLSSAIYIAKSWYCSYTNLTAYNNMGNGICLGVPLQYGDGTGVDFTAVDGLNMNCNSIRNIRAEFSGQDKTYVEGKKDNWGYGLGLGSGNGFYVDGFLSEKNDGYGVYTYLNFQNVHHVTNGYLENNNYYSRQEGRAKLNKQYVYDIQGNSCKFIKLENIYINESDKTSTIEVKGQAVLTRGALVFYNISYGGNLKISNPKNDYDIVHMVNCYYLLAENNNLMGQGCPVNVQELTLKKPVDGTIVPQKVKRGYQSVYRVLYVYVDSTTSQSGQITLRSYNSADVWKYLPATCEAGKLYKLCSVPWDCKTIELASDLPNNTPYNFVIFQYTGDKATYI